MSRTGISFDTLAPEYREAIQRAQQEHNISITPLQQLVGGWSGAVIYLVSVTAHDTEHIEHLVLKLDQKRKMATSDESTRHQLVLEQSPAEFVKQCVPGVAYEGLESEDALIIFYTIAGQSLHKFRTLSNYRQQEQSANLFAATNEYLLEAWNPDRSFEQFEHPQLLLKKWLGFRLDEGQKIESFIRQQCGLEPDKSGLIISGNIYPNPLHYAHDPAPWGPVRAWDVVTGRQHSDLNTNNILAKFSRTGNTLEGYYLIDFALFKDAMPLLYDQRYLEMSYLVQALSTAPLASVVGLIAEMAEHEFPDAQQVPVEMVGVNTAIRAGRTAFDTWVKEKYPSLQDDLWGQYWLGGVAAGLSYAHKAGQSKDVRLVGLIYAAANLKKFLRQFELPMPVEASELYDGERYISEAQEGAAGQVSKGKIGHNLPTTLTKFIGRESELADIRDILGDPQKRLITLTGPGGTGKTRLSIEASRAALNDFRDGVYFIDLAPLRDSDLVASTLAHTIGMRESGGLPSLENLKSYLADKEILLILDNFEQISEAAPIVAELLSAGPGINLIVTSRITLQIRGEHEYPIAPLATPPDNADPLESIEDYEAIALFKERAQAVQPKFELTQENSGAVSKICRRLDGLPLAIEIAAARIKMLPPGAMLKRLEESLDLLVGGAKDQPGRQQTMRATIDWSYELLSVEEQALFSRLGVFAGGFTLEAAEAINALLNEDEVFSGIEKLLNSSLLAQAPTIHDDLRFAMLQTIREYAREKAEASGSLEELRWAHSGYFADMAVQQLADGVYSSESVLWLQICDEEHDNFRAALEWTMQHPEGIPLMVGIMIPLMWYWFRYGHLSEGQEWAKRAVAVTAEIGPSPPRAMALIGRAMLALWSADLIVAAKYGREAVEMCQQLEFDEGLAYAKMALGVTLINQGKVKEAYPHLVDTVELFDQQGRDWFKATTLVHLANVSLGMGDADQSIKWLDMAMPHANQNGDPWNMAFALNNYGEVARVRGDHERAERYYRRTEDLYSRIDARGDHARLVHTFGYIAMHKGELDEARGFFEESLEEFREMGINRGMAECLAGLAGLAIEQGEYSWAAPLLSAAEHQLHAFGGAWWPADQVEIERFRETLKGELGDDLVAQWQQGERMGMEEAMNYALKGS